MKNWLTPVTAVAFAVLTLASCKKDEVKVTATPSAGLTLSASRTSVVLLQPNSAQTALTYTWNPITFATGDNSQVPAVSYQLQLAKSSDGFGYPATIIDAGTGTTKSITVGELNKALVGAGLTPNAATPVWMRIAAVVGSDTHSFVSNAVPLTATPYKECLPPNADTWGLVGPAGDGWPGATATDRELKWDCDAKAYVLRTMLNAGDFKFRQNKDWSINLGALTKPMTPGTAGTPLKLNGEDMTITTPGTYTVKLAVTGSGANVTAGTITITP